MLKPILCDTCLSCEKEILEHKIPIYASSEYTRTVKELAWFCSKKGRYATHSDRYHCPDYANVTLEDCEDVK